MLGRRKARVHSVPPSSRPQTAGRGWHQRSEPRHAEGGVLGAEVGRGQVEPVPFLPNCRRWRPTLLLEGS